jgi:hypothetical protein
MAKEKPRIKVAVPNDYRKRELPLESLFVRDAFG